MYAQQPQNAIQIRNALLSQDPALQDQASRRLGYTQPHIELPAILSAIKLDFKYDTERLSFRMMRRLLNAASSHVGKIPFLANPGAQKKHRRTSRSCRSDGDASCQQHDPLRPSTR